MLSIVVAFALNAAANQAEPPLVPHEPIVLATKGRFAAMLVDSGSHRLFAAHSGANKVTVYDLRSEKALELDAVGVNGVAVDANGGKVFAAGSGKKLYVFDRNTLSLLGERDLSVSANGIEFDPRRGMLYIDTVDQPNVWPFDPKSSKLGVAIRMSGEPTSIEYSPATNRVYLCVKDKDCVDVIDPEANSLAASWPAGGAIGPHGFAIDRKIRRGFCAGSGGILVEMNLTTGSIVANIEISPGADQIAFDPNSKRVYCACEGFISVVEETANGIKSIGNVLSPPGAHSLAVDPSTGDVWVCYTDSAHAYLERFSRH